MSYAEDMSAPAPRVFINRLDDPSLVLEAQYNPPELEETIGATWAKLTVPGLSHQVKQFTNTNDTTVKMQFAFSVTTGGEAEADRLIAARLFFKTSVRPRRAVGEIESAGAPRLYLFWPNFFTMTCVLTAATIKYPMFNRSARPTRMTVDATFEEIRDTIILADEFFRESP